jgi:hypothetical protein
MACQPIDRLDREHPTESSHELGWAWRGEHGSVSRLSDLLHRPQEQSAAAE